MWKKCEVHQSSIAGLEMGLQDFAMGFFFATSCTQAAGEDVHVKKNEARCLAVVSASEFVFAKKKN